MLSSLGLPPCRATSVRVIASRSLAVIPVCSCSAASGRKLASCSSARTTAPVWSQITRTRSAFQAFSSRAPACAHLAESDDPRGALDGVGVPDQIGDGLGGELLEGELTGPGSPDGATDRPPRCGRSRSVQAAEKRPLALFSHLVRWVEHRRWHTQVETPVGPRPEMSDPTALFGPVCRSVKRLRSGHSHSMVAGGLEEMS